MQFPQDLVQDHLTFRAKHRFLPKLQKAFGSSSPIRVVFSSLVEKINEHKRTQSRVLLLTDTYLVNVKKSNLSIRRFIPLSTIKGLTYSKSSTEFVVHVEQDYDYHYKSQHFEEIRSVLAYVNPGLKVTAKRVARLTVFVVTKKDLKKAFMVKEKFDRTHGAGAPSRPPAAAYAPPSISPCSPPGSHPGFQGSVPQGFPPGFQGSVPGGAQKSEEEVGEQSAAQGVVNSVSARTGGDEENKARLKSIVKENQFTYAKDKALGDVSVDDFKSMILQAKRKMNEGNKSGPAQRTVGEQSSSESEEEEVEPKTVESYLVSRFEKMSRKNEGAQQGHGSVGEKEGEEQHSEEDDFEYDESDE